MSHKAAKRAISPPPTILKFPAKKLKLDHQPQGVVQHGRDTLKIVSWNADDLSPYLYANSGYTPYSTKPINTFFTSTSTPTETEELSSLRQILKKHAWPDVFCVQETKFKEFDKRLMRLAHSAATNKHSKDEPSYDLHYTLPEPTNPNIRNRGMYGVATYIKSTLSPLVTSSRTVDWDTEGRVHILTLCGYFTIINLYAVNGTDRPFFPTNKTRHERKREVMRLLAVEIDKLDSEVVVIVGDFNISRYEIDCYPNLRMQEPHVLARNEFNQEWVPVLDMVDVVREKWGEEGKVFTWFGRGYKFGSDMARVDMIFTNRKFVNEGGVVDCGVEMREDRMEKSDHCPLWIICKFDKDRQAS